MDRLFLAVPLTAGARDAIFARLREALPGGLPGREVPAQNWHLTLRFLGDTPEPLRRRVGEELRAGSLGPPFEIGFGGHGAFPRENRATVLWLGVAEGSDELRALAATVESAARRAGFPPERRPFTPHLTLSRLRTPEDVRPVLARLAPFSVSMPVHEVVLYRSRLGTGPASYQGLERFALG